MTLVAVSKKLSKFDPKTFLSTINGGRKIDDFPKKRTIFAQGDSGDAVFYIKDGFLRRRLPYRAASPAVLRNRDDRLLCDANR
jgi:hypothetical protein